MSIHFRLKTGNLSVPCYKNLNLLAHAQLEELDVGSQCGGHGICGKDKVKIVSDPAMLTSITPVERKHLLTSELKGGWRLSCQCWPLEDDLEISISF